MRTAYRYQPAVLPVARGGPARRSRVRQGAAAVQRFRLVELLLQFVEPLFQIVNFFFYILRRRIRGLSRRHLRDPIQPEQRDKHNAQAVPSESLSHNCLLLSL